MRFIRNFGAAARISGALLGCSTVLAAAADSPRLVHRFLQIQISPDASLVASVEGDSPPNEYYPPIRDLVIRRVRDGEARSIALPCGRVPECWPLSRLDSGRWASELQRAYSGQSRTIRVHGCGGRQRRIRNRK